MARADDDDGVRVVLSAPQLAAILARESISHTEMLSNRLWGGLQVVGGVLEMAGAGALCVMPEPTMASKAGCVVFGMHGSDTAAAGLRQIWTGLDTDTLTHRGTAKLAEFLKISPDMADHIGLSLDIAVPFGFAGSVKAARVSQIAIGRIRLQRNEARVAGGPGGHTIAKHVGRTEAQLRERLRLEPMRSAVSSFRNLERAELAITEVMRAKSAQIGNWARHPAREPTLTLKHHVGGDIGYGIRREMGKLTPMNEVTVVLLWRKYNGMRYYILTAYVD